MHYTYNISKCLFSVDLFKVEYHRWENGALMFGTPSEVMDRSIVKLIFCLATRFQPKVSLLISCPPIFCMYFYMWLQAFSLLFPASEVWNALSYKLEAFLCTVLHLTSGFVVICEPESIEYKKCILWIMYLPLYLTVRPMP